MLKHLEPSALEMVPLFKWFLWMTHFGPPPSATDTHRSGPHQQVFLGNFLIITFPSLPRLGSLTFGI